MITDGTWYKINVIHPILIIILVYLEDRPCWLLGVYISWTDSVFDKNIARLIVLPLVN